MITFVTVLILITIFTESIKAGLVIATALLSFNFYIQPTIHSEEYAITTSKIYSIGGNYNSINGQFILGTGSIGSTPMYSYFIENPDHSKEKRFIASKGTKVYEGNYTPKLEVTTCTAGQKFDWVAGFSMAQLNCPYYIQRKIYLPEKSVIQTFSIK